jgi:hypothetical protein
LKGLPALRQVYLWKTKVSPEGAAAFAAGKTNQAKIERLRRQVARLEAEIEGERVVVVGGVAAGPTTAPAVAATQPGKAEGAVATAGGAGVAPAATAAVPVNTVCPVSGKPVDVTKFVEFKGRRIGFCCENCPKAFEKEPGKFEGKVVVAGVEKK